MSVGSRKRKKDRAPRNVLPSPLSGRLAMATKGREAGRCFLIVGASDADGRVYIADGRKRRLSEPKLKSLRHLVVYGECEGAAERMSAGTYTDGDIRRAVRCPVPREMPKGE